MKVGDIVNVYEDPITEKKLEGKATLISRIVGSNNSTYERWYVRFEGEHELYERSINVRQ